MSLRADTYARGRVVNILTKCPACGYTFAPDERRCKHLGDHNPGDFGLDSLGDVDDYRREQEHPHLQLLHRPNTDTHLKNGRKGERPVSISSDACDIIDDYLENRRPDVTDDYGREPLLASPQGRITKSTIRKYVYKWSRPCVVGAECPHDRGPDECDATNELDQASKCPSSVTPHPIRRGYSTPLLKAGVSVEVVGDRCNVSPAVIDEHYDVRTEEEKMRQRQALLRQSLE